VSAREAEGGSMTALQSNATATSPAKKETPNMNAATAFPRRKRLLALLAAATALLLGAISPAPASALGLEFFDVKFSEEDATPFNPADDPVATQAGSHPYAMTTSFGLNWFEGPRPFPDFEAVGGQMKDMFVEQIRGFTGDSTAYPQCSTVDFMTNAFDPELGGTVPRPSCPKETAVGVTATNIIVPPPIYYFNAALFNLEPPPGVVARLGFSVLGVRVVIDISLKDNGDYNIVAKSNNTPQTQVFLGSVVQLWGDPTDPSHDPARGECVDKFGQGFTAATEGEINFASGSFGDECPISSEPRAFITTPTRCAGPLATNWEADSWLTPGEWVKGSVLTHDSASPPNSIGFTGCGKLAFLPEVDAGPTTKSAESGTGADFSIKFHDEGLTNPDGLAQSHVKKTVVTLPEGMTVNPSVGEGLGFCSPADYEREGLAVPQGQGCPEESKLGTLEVHSPLIDGAINGSVYLAQQGDPVTPELENPFDSLIALYMVLRRDEDNIFLKIPAKVEPDPKTGQLITTVDGIPELPFSSFNLHFREGQRPPLVTPPACGSYDIVAELTPWSDTSKTVTQVSTFEITEGVGNGPCPPGGVPPFRPDFEAGSLNNNAKSYSPFNMRLIRHDGEQDMTKFGSILPPGVVGKLAGVEECSEAAIAAARTKDGREELAAPSCPASSQIGRALAGAGVGSALTYVPAKVYLSGPYQGAPLSVVAITPAVAGPFDAGNVVTRIALTLDPETAEVEVLGASSDPIPHILKGIPLKVRDIRVYVDRDQFILNPTSCDPSSARATLFGGFLDVFSDADDVPVELSTRFQAANCLNLGFKPKLALNLRGGTKRGDFPGLKAVLKPRPGDANIAGAQVTLPRSAFLEQSHIRTICTRVQFAAQNCPKGSIYGRAVAKTPLLDEPLVGNVILRSSDNKLPDMVLALKGLVDVNVSSRIDSKNGGIRNTFDIVPDAPVSEFTLTLQGGQKGLIVNSRDLCEGRTSRASVRILGHNGKLANLRPRLQPQCGGKRKKR
jgi:hypothetical protein